MVELLALFEGGRRMALHTSLLVELGVKHIPMLVEVAAFTKPRLGMGKDKAMGWLLWFGGQIAPVCLVATQAIVGKLAMMPG